MKDVNDVEIKVGMSVYELGIPASAEDQEHAGLPTVLQVFRDGIALSNGSVWINEHGKLPVVVKI